MLYWQELELKKKRFPHQVVFFRYRAAVKRGEAPGMYELAKLFKQVSPGDTAKHGMAADTWLHGKVKGDSHRVVGFRNLQTALKFAARWPTADASKLGYTMEPCP